MRSNPPAVAELVDQGWEVKIEHLRLDNVGRLMSEEKFKQQRKRPFPAGGSTWVKLSSPDGRIITASAICSLYDMYDPVLGERIAVGRAWLKALGGRHPTD